MVRNPRLLPTLFGHRLSPSFARHMRFSELNDAKFSQPLTHQHRLWLCAYRRPSSPVCCPAPIRNSQGEQRLTCSKTLQSLPAVFLLGFTVAFSIIHDRTPLLIDTASRVHLDT